LCGTVDNSSPDAFSFAPRSFYQNGPIRQPFVS
jgi:hypothetical protein